MRIELAPGEKLTVVFTETDGRVEVSFSDAGITVETDIADDKRRSGVIYQETFSYEDEEENDVIFPPAPDGWVFSDSQPEFIEPGEYVITRQEGVGECVGIGAYAEIRFANGVWGRYMFEDIRRIERW